MAVPIRLRPVFSNLWAFLSKYALGTVQATRQMTTPKIFSGLFTIPHRPELKNISSVHTRLPLNIASDVRLLPKKNRDMCVPGLKPPHKSLIMLLPHHHYDRLKYNRLIPGTDLFR